MHVEVHPLDEAPYLWGVTTSTEGKTLGTVRFRTRPGADRFARYLRGHPKSVATGVWDERAQMVDVPDGEMDVSIARDVLHDALDAMGLPQACVQVNEGRFEDDLTPYVEVMVSLPDTPVVLFGQDRRVEIIIYATHDTQIFHSSDVVAWLQEVTFQIAHAARKHGLTAHWVELVEVEEYETG